MEEVSKAEAPEETAVKEEVETTGEPEEEEIELERETGR